MADRVVVPVDFDATGRAELRGAAGDLDRIGDRAKKAEGPIGGLKKALAGLITVEMLRRIAQYTQRLFDLGTAAEETASKFATVFGPAAEGLDRTLRETANAMGLTQTEARGLAATVGAVVQGMGYGQQASADYAAEILRIAGDITSFSNVAGGTEQVIQALTSAITGEREALKTLGIVISETDVQQRAMADTGKASADALTRQEKAAATLALVTERAGVAIGDLDRTSESTANSARALTARIREQEEQFARLNTVTFDYILRTVSDLIAANESAGDSFAVKLARKILEASGRMVQFIGTIGNTIKAFGGLTKAVAETVSPKGGFSVFALQMNSLLGLLTIFQKRTLQAALGIRTMRKAWNEWTGDDKGANDQIHRIEELREAIAQANADLDRFGTQFAGGLGFLPSATLTPPAGFEGVLASFDELASNLDTLPDIGGVLDSLSSDLASAINDGGKRASDARKKAQEQAEKDRREAVDAEHAARALQIAAMQEGLEKEIAEIDLAFDEQREAYRRGYGLLTAEETRLFEAAQARRKIMAVAAADRGAAVAGRAVGQQPDRPGPGSTTPLADEQARIEAFRDAMRTVLQDVEVEAVDTAQTLGDKVLGTLANVMAEIPPALISSTLSILSSFESLVDTQMGSLRDRTSDQVAALQDQMNALPRNAVAERKALEDEIAGIEAAAYEREKALLVKKKRLAVAQVVAQTAIGVANALASAPFPLNLANAFAVGLAGAAQIAAINSETIAPPRTGGGSAAASGGSAPKVEAGILVGQGIQSSNAARREQVNVSNTVRLEGQVLDVKTKLQDLRIELRRADRRESYHTGGRRGTL